MMVYVAYWYVSGIFLGPEDSGFTPGGCHDSDFQLHELGLSKN